MQGYIWRTQKQLVEKKKNNKKKSIVKFYKGLNLYIHLNYTEL